MKRTLTAAGLAALIAFCGLAVAADAPQGMVERIYGPYAPAVWAVAEGLVKLAIIVLIALPFQWLMPGVRRRAKILSYEYWLDILYYCQNVWLSLIAFYVALEWIVEAVYGNSGAWLPALAQLPFWAQVLIAVWAFDFAVYWRHRWEHRIPALWSFHAVHHTTEKVDVLTTIRLHPLEVALGVLFNAAVMRLGMDPAATVLGFAIYIHYNYFIHANVRIRFPGFLKYVLVSPFMHHWHHAMDEAAMGKNVGVVFAWNDWLFGTAYHPDHWPQQYGLAAPAAERVSQSYLRHTLYPLQYFIARMRA